MANYGGNFIATFLHTRSFNILRRTGTRVKRKTSENQRFSEEFVGLIDPSVTPERLELSTHWLRVSCSTNWATESCFIERFSQLRCKGKAYFWFHQIFWKYFYKNLAESFQESFQLRYVCRNDDSLTEGLSITYALVSVKIIVVIVNRIVGPAFFKT